MPYRNSNKFRHRRQIFLSTSKAGFPIPTSGLSLWLKADSESYSDNDPVGTATDRSGNGNNLTQSTAAHRPTFKTNIVNGKPVYRFDGTDDHLDGGANLIAIADGEDKALSVFVVHKSTSEIARIVMWENSGEFTILNVGAADIYNAFKRDGTTTKTHDSSAGNYASQFVVVSMITDGTSVDLWEDNSQLINAQDWDLTSVDVTMFTVGANNNASNPLDGDIAELIIYNRAVTSDERSDIETYLANKYGITLS